MHAAAERPREKILTISVVEPRLEARAARRHRDERHERGAVVVEEVRAAELEMAHVEVERRSADERGFRVELGALMRVEQLPLAAASGELVAGARANVEDQSFGAAFVELEVAAA